jgi:hypothetical protein
MQIPCFREAVATKTSTSSTEVLIVEVAKPEKIQGFVAEAFRH